MSNAHIAIIGASGGLGSAFVRVLARDPSNTIYAFSRNVLQDQFPNVQWGRLDFIDEASLYEAAEMTLKTGPLDMVIIATGVLHDAELQPEKSLSEINLAHFERSFFVNTIGPALIAKYFLPKLQRNKRAVFATLSARVGSISDNRLGGWHSYRASKAALNMLIKTTSLEMARTRKYAIVVGLHPGTVASNLSEPFVKRIPENRIFQPEDSAKRLFSVLKSLTPEDSGKVFAWDGSEVPP